MRPRLAPLSLLASVLALLPIAAAGCGEEESEATVNEGEPLELGEMAYNVQITRFLNPSSPEDATYLKGAPPLGEGEQYLAVFMQVENHGEEAESIPQPFKVVDTRGRVYVQEKVDNPFALPVGTSVPPGESVPGPESAAANGPIEGAMMLFIVDEGATENRPLQLRVPGSDDVGAIELDL